MKIVGLVIGIILIGGLSIFAIWNIVEIIRQIKKKRKRKAEKNIVQTIDGNEVNTDRKD